MPNRYLAYFTGAGLWRVSQTRCRRRDPRPRALRSAHSTRRSLGRAGGRPIRSRARQLTEESQRSAWWMTASRWSARFGSILPHRVPGRTRRQRLRCRVQRVVPKPAGYAGGLHKLLVMGFNREKAENALMACDFSLSMALDALYGRQLDQARAAPPVTRRSPDRPSGAGDGEEDAGDGPRG